MTRVEPNEEEKVYESKDVETSMGGSYFKDEFDLANLIQTKA